jgi:hypothetical protein
MSHKKLPNAKFVDYGDMTVVFVDDLATIEEFGNITHVVFARFSRGSCGGEVERQGVLRLIIPTELRVAMGRRLMTDAANTNTTAAAENAQLH